MVTVDGRREHLVVCNTKLYGHGGLCMKTPHSWILLEQLNALQYINDLGFLEADNKTMMLERQ